MAERRKATGISNRETPEEEARERRENPAVTPDVPPDGPEAKGDQPDHEFSNKAGARSIAQKHAGTRHPDEPVPPANKVAGAFGKEDRDA